VIVRHEYERTIHRASHSPKLQLQFSAQSRIKRRKRFIKQQDRRPGCQRPR